MVGAQLVHSFCPPGSMGPRWLMMVEMSTRRAAAPFNRFNPVISLFDSTSTVAHASSVLCNIYAICTLHIVQSKYSSLKEIQQEVQGLSWPRLLLEVLAGGTPVTEEQEQDESRILGGYIYVYNIEICVTDSTESSLN